MILHQQVAVPHNILVLAAGGAGDQGLVRGVKLLLPHLLLDDLRPGETQASLGLATENAVLTARQNLESAQAGSSPWTPAR